MLATRVAHASEDAAIAESVSARARARCANADSANEICRRRVEWNGLERGCGFDRGGRRRVLNCCLPGNGMMNTKFEPL